MSEGLFRGITVCIFVFRIESFIRFLVGVTGPESAMFIRPHVQIRDHPFKTSACLRGGRGVPIY